MASYILFSPQNAPDAWSIAGVLALTLLPFTVIGPFVSTYLDRWSRRQVAVISDIIRSVLGVLIGFVVFFNLTTGIWVVVLYGSLLVAMSVNRFMLAGLSAGLQYTVDDDEYLTASSIIPTVGPLGVVIGAAIGFAAVAGLGGFLPSYQADAVVFWIASLGFIGSVFVAARFSRDGLGPEPGQPTTRMRDVAAGLGRAWRHLGSRPQAALGLSGMVVSRLLFGLFSVITILAVRNHFNTEIPAALADMTLWGLMTGAGFIASSPFVPLLARRMGLRRTAVVVLVVAGLAQVVPVLVGGKWPLFVASFFIGLGAQSFKICVDTLVQAHVDEEYKGRVFVFYDMGFNAAFVIAAVIAAVVLPPTGVSVTAFVVMTLVWLGSAVVFDVLSRRIGAVTFEKGTEDLTGITPVAAA